MAVLASNNGRPVGRMTLRVAAPDGTLLAERRAGNMVLHGGALLIAQLFSGAGGAKPIDTVGVGFARDPGTADLTALTRPADTEKFPLAALRTALPPGSFTIADRDGVVQVSVAARFKPTVVLADVTEAGLLSGDALYNQVIFEPVTLAVGQDVTLFWQIDFPFGH
ncbi:MAG: hypothetical protein V4574_10510 [Pseudomonadota bacterium]